MPPDQSQQPLDQQQSLAWQQPMDQQQPSVWQQPLGQQPVQSSLDQQQPPQQQPSAWQPDQQQQPSTWQQPSDQQQAPTWQQPSDQQQPSAWQQTSSPPQPQPAWQQSSDQQQPSAWQQSGQFSAQQPAGQTPVSAAQTLPVKKSRKVPIIIAAAVVALLVIGGGIALAATGVLSNLFGEKSAVAALYEGTENLFYETSSATLEVRAGINVTLKWDLGEDLAHSTIWGYTGGTGFVYKDDTIYVYVGDDLSSSRGSSSGTMIVTEESDIIREMNRAFRDNYNIDIDLNKLVKNGRFDRDYLEELNQRINDTSLDTGSIYGLSPDDIDTVKVGEIIDDFLSKEVNKEDVYQQFMSGVDKDSSGGTTTYEATIDPAAFFATLGNYAAERGRDADYANAADEIRTLCDEAEVLGSYISDFTIEISVEKNILVGLVLDLNMSSGAVSVAVKVSDVNATDLDNDAKLQSILDSPSGSGSYGDFGSFL
jgi:hypothetical protein